jgi:hypothetical protein
MTSPYIIIRRYPYEEPYATELSICVSNGYFGGEMRIFVNVEDIAKIGQELKKFPELSQPPFCLMNLYRYRLYFLSFLLLQALLCLFILL